MRRTTSLIALSAVLALAVASPLQGDQPPEDLRADVSRGGPTTWASAIAGEDRRADAIAQGLIDVFRNGDRKADDRAQAIRVLGKLSSKVGLAFCLENLQLAIEVETDGDSLKSAFHCQLALVDMGFRVVPDVIQAGLAGRSRDDHLALSWVLLNIVRAGSDEGSVRAVARDLIEIYVRRLGVSRAPGRELFLKALGG